jgi:hypothetical protein
MFCNLEDSRRVVRRLAAGEALVCVILVADQSLTRRKRKIEAVFGVPFLLVETLLAKSIAEPSFTFPLISGMCGTESACIPKSGIKGSTGARG